MAALLNDPEIEEEEIYKNLGGDEVGVEEDDLESLEGEEGEESEEDEFNEDGDEMDGSDFSSYEEEDH
jgi:hypothetical protein